MDMEKYQVHFKRLNKVSMETRIGWIKKKYSKNRSEKRKRTKKQANDDSNLEWVNSFYSNKYDDDDDDDNCTNNIYINQLTLSELERPTQIH